jgi:hypothetical protein
MLFEVSEQMLRPRGTMGDAIADDMVVVVGRQEDNRRRRERAMTRPKMRLVTVLATLC